MNVLMRGSRALTLVELLVAITITLALAALLLLVTQGILRLWHRAQDEFTADIQAKLTLDSFERDLQSALFRESGEAWFAVDVISAPSQLTVHGWRTTGIIKPSGTESLDLVPPAIDGVPSSVAQARFGLSGAWIRFITTNVESKSSSNPGGSQPVAVSYQIARRPLSGSISASNPATVRYTLFRSVVANDTTLDNGLNLLAAGYASSTSAFPGARSARSMSNPNTADAIASNVVDVGVWLHRRNSSNELDRLFPESSGDTTHVASNREEFPEVVDVMLRVLTEEGARAIESIESGMSSITRPIGINDAEWWWSVVEANSRVYVRRIQVKGEL